MDNDQGVCGCGGCYDPASVRTLCSVSDALKRVSGPLAALDLVIRSFKSKKFLDKHVAQGLSRSSIPSVMRNYRCLIKCDGTGLVFVKVRAHRLDEHMRPWLFMPFGSNPVLMGRFVRAYADSVDLLSCNFGLAPRTHHLITVKACAASNEKHAACHALLARWLCATEYLISHPGCRTAPAELLAGGVSGLPNGHRMAIIWSLMDGTFVSKARESEIPPLVEPDEGSDCSSPSTSGGFSGLHASPSHSISSVVDYRPGIRGLMWDSGRVATPAYVVDGSRKRIELFERAHNLTQLTVEEKLRLVTHILAVEAPKLAICEAMICLFEGAPLPDSSEYDNVD